jgi:hypothetical protein
MGAVHPATTPVPAPSEAATKPRTKPPPSTKRKAEGAFAVRSGSARGAASAIATPSALTPDAKPLKAAGESAAPPDDFGGRE